MLQRHKSPGNMGTRNDIFDVISNNPSSGTMAEIFKFDNFHESSRGFYPRRILITRQFGPIIARIRAIRVPSPTVFFICVKKLAGDASTRRTMNDNQEEYPVILSNGQRIYTPPGAKICKTPPKGSEVFVGNLPRDLYEDELVPLFTKVGPIYKLRLMMDFSGLTRGFAFVHFFTVEAANVATKRFNDYHLKRPSGAVAKITVHVSLDNCRLFFGNVPRGLSAEEIEKDLGKVVEGVVKVFAFSEKRTGKANRGFAFVEFETHAMAAIARRKLLSGVLDLWGTLNMRVYVDWAEPEPMVDPEVLQQVSILFFRNVPGNWPSHRFKSFICRLLSSLEMERVYKKNNYAFVHFYNHEEAAVALRLLQSASKYLVFNGKEIEVEWARPVNYSKRSRANQLPDNFCTSVPPRLRRLVLKNKRTKHYGQSCFDEDPRKGRSDGGISSSDESDLFSQIDLAAAEDFLAARFRELALTL